MVSTGGDSAATSLAQPGVVIFLVLVLGAVLYLTHKRYMRRRAGYITSAILVLALGLISFQMYRAG